MYHEDLDKVAMVRLLYFNTQKRMRHMDKTKGGSREGGEIGWGWGKGWGENADNCN